MATLVFRSTPTRNGRLPTCRIARGCFVKGLEGPVAGSPGAPCPRANLIHVACINQQHATSSDMWHLMTREKLAARPTVREAIDFYEFGRRLEVTESHAAVSFDETVESSRALN